MPLTTTNAHRVAVTVVTVGVIGLALVLGLWQRVDAACVGAGFDPSDPVTTCQPPGDADLRKVSVDAAP